MKRRNTSDPPNVDRSMAPRRKMTLEQLRAVFQWYDYRTYREEQLRVSRDQK